MTFRLESLITIILLFIFLISLPLNSQELSLSDYINQVRENHSGIVGGEKIKKGLSQRLGEGSLLFSPGIFGMAQYSDDRKPRLTPAFQGRETHQGLYTLGLAQKFRFGLEAKLSYYVARTQILGAAPGILPYDTFHDMGPQLELVQPLWKNWMGRETRATEVLMKAQTQAMKYGESFKIRSILRQAEMVYWQLAQARKTIKVQSEVLDRAVKLRNWNASRSRMELSDKAGYLQSTAALNYRELEYKAALQEEKALSRVFNILRGRPAESVEENLDSLDRQKIREWKIPEREKFRDDVLAAKEQLKMAYANAELSMERNRPTVEAFSTLGLNGRDPQASTAWDKSLEKDNPYLLVGVRFNAPLDWVQLKKDKEGYAKERMGAKLQFERKVFEQEAEWADLLKRWDDSMERLELAYKIENAEKEKLMYERMRLNKGRTVTYQVITFEQDYATAQVLRIKNETEILNIYSQLKMFGSGSGPGSGSETGSESGVAP